MLEFSSKTKTRFFTASSSWVDLSSSLISVVFCRRLLKAASRRLIRLSISAALSFTAVIARNCKIFHKIESKKAIRHDRTVFDPWSTHQVCYCWRCIGRCCSGIAHGYWRFNLLLKRPRQIRVSCVYTHLWRIKVRGWQESNEEDRG